MSILILDNRSPDPGRAIYHCDQRECDDSPMLSTFQLGQVH
jgi:hypothetical protein